LKPSETLKGEDAAHESAAFQKATPSKFMYRTKMWDYYITYFGHKAYKNSHSQKKYDDIV
jgi:hypothetical protein